MTTPAAAPAGLPAGQLIGPEYHGVMMVTVVNVCQMYGYMLLGATAGLAGKSSAQLKWADRAFGNYIEQVTMFMLGLWMHAFFVDAEDAAIVGWTFIGFRILYLVIWMLEGKKGDYIGLATVPMYGIVLWLQFSVTLKCVFGFDIAAKLHPVQNQVGPFIFCLVFFAYFMGVVMNILPFAKGFFPEDEPEATADEEAALVKQPEPEPEPEKLPEPVKPTQEKPANECCSIL